MSDESSMPDLPELTEYLKSLGHSESEIKRIVEKLHERDIDAMVDSIMDLIDAGEFDISSIIEEALEDEPEA